MIRCALLVVLTGCDALFGLREVPADARHGVFDPDAGYVQPDTPTSDAKSCVGTYLPMCVTFASVYSFDTVTTIDTSTDPRCIVLDPPAAGYPAVCVIAANTISVSAQLTVTGSRAIAFAAKYAITVTSTGTINGSSVARGGNGGSGPAGNASSLVGCGASSGSQQKGSLLGAGGGAGGSFYGLGGNGGMSDVGTQALPNGTLSTPPATLRGGCAGGSGGPSHDGAVQGSAGDSGGAVYLVTSGPITIAGAVLANGGGGGSPGPANNGENAGGGGGGSGGLIVLDAAALDLSGYVVAMGAGGGGGGSGPSSGTSGSDWSAVTPLAAPSGGTGATFNGGNGGAGSSATVTGGNDGGSYDNQATGGGAGGGGGGAGFILTHGTVSQASHVYPAAIAVQ